MPEGHSVHRLAAAFRAEFIGHAVAASSPQGRFAAGAERLDGRVLTAAEAYGKQMFLGFSGDIWLRVHLGLYGMWRFFGPGLEGVGRRRNKDVAEFPPEPRGAVRLRVVTSAHVADLSGPTLCAVVSRAEMAVAVAGFGDDPLRDDADPARAYAKLRASRSPLGLLLMRQDIVAGIGNIYRAELLFRARVDPHRPGRELSAATWDVLWNDISEMLREGVRTGRIVTTGDAKLRHRASNYVAHRGGKPCLVCGNPVLAEPMAGRTLYWCAHCQTG